MHNFAHPSHSTKTAKKGGSIRERWRRLSRFKKTIITTILVLTIIIILLGVWALVNIRVMKRAYAEGLAAKHSFEYAQVEVGNQNFPQAIKNLQEASTHFDNAYSQLRRFAIYKYIPGVRPQIQAVENILLAGKSLSQGLESLANVGAAITSVTNVKDASFAEISAEQKRELLKTLNESTADLQGVKAEIELATVLIEEIPDHGLLKPIRSAVEPVKQQLPLLETLIHQAIPTAESLPSILGYPNEKTYLFLLQNNREMRPTGGFIGTYGILKMDAGEIAAFSTDNVYNLDNASEGRVTEPSPGPIAQHTSTQNWLFRNINWSPDFPTTARKAEDKYYEEGGAEQNIDGVIAVTPTFIESLLELTGPITVDGIEFTSDNFFETLEYQVELNYDNNGLTEAQRKEVIGHLSEALLDKLLGLPRSQFATIWETFVKDVNSKQILIYLDDSTTQNLVTEQNWAGEMKSAGEGSDFVMVVDANLAALKTDEKMERSLSYAVTKEGDDYVGTLDMHYQNNTEHINEFYTRYRTYTRIYLPAGTELLEQSGFMTNDKLHNGKPTDPDVYEESYTQINGEQSSYTVVGGFISIEPQETGTLHLKYRLPSIVAEKIKQGEYTLYVQKEAGTIAHGLTVSVDVGKKITNVTPFDFTKEIGDTRLSLSTDLSIDRKFSVELK
ncbi:MAG: DUF4012 domain-containing protein [Candidatus Kerfeldbacteria bacterium]|nr:DUF4012 domain-containing protein [Candidatus Kerfeldbacteria bacterium]